MKRLKTTNKQQLCVIKQVWQHISGDNINEAGEVQLHAAECSVPSSDVRSPVHLVRRKVLRRTNLRQPVLRRDYLLQGLL